MKIVFVFDGGLPAQGYGGGHQVLRGFACALTRLGHYVSVVLSGDDEIGAASQDAGVDYRPQRLPWTKWVFARTAAATLRVARELQADVVCCFTAEVALVAPICRALGVPVTMYIAAPELRRIPFTTDLRTIRQHAGPALQRLGALASTIVMTTSDHTARQAIDLWRIPSTKIRSVGLGLDAAYLEQPHAIPDRTPEAPLRLLSVGRVSLGQKPLDVMADGLVKSSIPWSHWTIIGSDQGDEALRDRIRQLGIADRVRMVGFMPPAAVARQLQRHDLVLLPSRYESFFLAVYEAVACHRMVVTNDVAEIKTKLGESGLVVLARDATASAYADALRVAWTRLQTSATDEDPAGRRIRQHYSWEAAGQRFVNVVRELQGQAPRPAWPSVP
jgi:glycosyltransferase involved in cell wall biosynthesis